MSLKTTTKDIKANYSYIVCAGYCELWHLLNPILPIAHTSGIYGWNYDLYVFDNLAICTGYRGMPGKRALGIEKYESLAKEVYKDTLIKYDEKQERLKELLSSFCEENKQAIIAKRK